MKKSLMIFLTLMLIAGVGLIWGVQQIYAGQNAIMITENTLEGDIRAADGLEAYVRTQRKSDLIRWETQLEIQSDRERTFNSQTHSELRYNVNEGKLDYRSGSLILRNNELMKLVYEDGYHVGYAGNVAVNATGEGILSQMKGHSFYQMFADVAKEVPAGATVTREVRPADYFSHYPLYMEVNMDANTVWYVNEWALGDFLEIRVPESHLMSVSITKNHPNGAVTDISAELIGGSLSIKSPAVVTDKSMFYTIYAVRNDDGALISPELKYGNGIYCLPFTEEENGRNMKSDEMQKIFDLSGEACPVGLLADAAGEKLYLVIKEERELKCKVITLDYNGVEPGKVPKAVEAAEYVLGEYPEESEPFLMELEEEQLWMVFYDGTILYQPDVVTFAEEQRIRGQIADDNFAYGRYGWDYDLDYADGKLALICAENYWNCSFELYVFDRGGLQYRGAFRHSLDDLNTGMDYCLMPEQPLEISW